MTVLLPVLPLAPLTVIQLAPLVTVQTHPLGVVTVVLPPPPEAAILPDVEDRLYRHGMVENANAFDKALAATPAGPTAAIAAT